VVVAIGFSPSEPGIFWAIGVRPPVFPDGD
jgi:hypothetical protein